jgi:hypothetical protein
MAVLVVLVACLLSAPAFATGPDEARRADTIAGQTLSPFPGVTLDSCTSPNAAGWRQDIRTWVDEGVPTEEIKRRLEAPSLPCGCSTANRRSLPISRICVTQSSVAGDPPR